MSTYRIKRFSYSFPEGQSYINAQVNRTAGYMVNPLDDAVVYVDKTRIGKITPIKRKTKMIRRVTSPIRKYVSRKLK